MRRVYTLFITCCLTMSSWAQTQQGYVKTLGRPNQKGVALSGVTVRVKGAHNAVLSKNNGMFSVQIQGESYSIQQVQKSGYELNDVGVIGRRQAYSANVPLTLVMVSTQQLQTDKQRIEDNAYKTAEKNFKARMAQLEKQKTDNAITSEQYRQQIQELQDKFEKYQSLIDGLASHYAHVDYDELDEKEQEINLCIENGDLERADQLLQQIGIQQRIADIESRLAAGQSLMDEANAEMDAVLKQQEKDAEHLYQLYTIALSRFDNEKARTYIETRAALDTTNCDWQYKAGDFLLLLSDIDCAMTYLNRSIRLAESKPEYHSYRWQCYRDLGHTYLERNQYQKAIDFFQKALDDDDVKGSDDISRKAMIYTSIITTYRNLGDYSNALRYIQKMIDMKDSLDYSGLDIGRIHYSVFVATSNMAQICSDLGKFKEAENYFNQAINFTKDKYLLGNVYNNYGVLLRRQKKYNEALEMYKKALETQLETFGSNHPAVGRSYGNIGTIYMETGQYAEAENYILKSLQILSNFFGTNHTNIAGIYLNLGSLLAFQEKWQDAIPYYSKALNLFIELIGDAHHETAIAYHGLGYCYAKYGDTEKGIKLMEKALAIIKEKRGENNPYLKEIEKDISEVSK